MVIARTHSVDSTEANFAPSSSTARSAFSSHLSYSPDSVPSGAGVFVDSTPSFNLVQVIAIPLSTCPQTTPNVESALRRTPSKSGRRVRWADDSDNEKKTFIQLTELLDISSDISAEIQGRVWQLSQDAQGCRDVQEVIQSAAPQRACALAAEMRGHVGSAALCPHANHVLRKVIMTVPPLAFNFILEELLSHIAETARHRFGCRIIECLLSQGSPDQVALISERLLGNAASLCSHMYGNFVMQRLFEHASAHHRSTLMQLLLSNVTTVGANFFGSAVLGKAFQYGSDVERQVLIASLTSVPGLLAAIAKYKHGKCLVTSVLEALTGVEHEAAVRQLSGPPLKAPKANRAIS